MIDAKGYSIDWQESGAGPCLLLVHGSFANAAAWRPVRARLDTRYRVVATSLLGYGGTAERRAENETSLEAHVDQIAALVAHAGEPVHLVAFSFGAIAALAACLTDRVTLASLTLIDAIPLDLLRQTGEPALFEAVARETMRFEREALAGEPDAARHVIDLWSGAGAYDAMGENARRVIRASMPAMLRDRHGAQHFIVPLADYRRLAPPTHIIVGSDGHPAMARMAEILAGAIPHARLSRVAGASHQLIFTHADEVATLIDGFIAAPRETAPE